MTLILSVGAVGLLLIGIAGIVLSAHVLRIIFSIALLESGANLLLLLSSFQAGAVAPIRLKDGFPAVMADPVPQALVLTAIVIGVGVLALALALAMRILAAHGTLDAREIRQAMDEAIAARAGVPPEGGGQAPRSGPDRIPAGEVGGHD